MKKKQLIVQSYQMKGNIEQKIINYIMKIESVKPTENRFIKKIKQAFSNRFSKLKTLAKDVFEREASRVQCFAPY